MNFADNLASLRKAKGLRQPELAEALGLSRSTIAMYESGKRTPDYEILERIADFFNVDINTLLGFAGVPKFFLNIKEQEMVVKFRTLNKEAQKRIMNQIEFEIYQAGGRK